MGFFEFKDPDREKPEKPTFSEDKHTATLAAIAKYSKPAQKGLQELEVFMFTSRGRRKRSSKMVPIFKHNIRWRLLP